MPNAWKPQQRAPALAGRAEVGRGRVVLRPPSDDVDSSRGWQISGVTFIVVVVAVFFQPFHDGAPHHAQLYYGPGLAVAVICCCVTYSMYQILLSSRFCRRQFVEGSIEITPSGVQLVSTYGTQSNPFPFSSPSTSSMSPLLPNTKQQHQQSQQKEQPRRRKPIIVSIEKNEHHRKDCVNNDIIQPQHHIHKVIHAQIPISQIIDIIVMEIVWPHCVWSQVAFRTRNIVTTIVDKTSDYDDDGIGNGACSVVADDWSNNLEGQQTKRLEEHEMTPLPPVNKATNNLDESHDENSHRHPLSPSPWSPPSEATIKQLLQKGEVSIIPAFSPKDCHGMLSYEECLHVQAEVEKLLGIN